MFSTQILKQHAVNNMTKWYNGIFEFMRLYLVEMANTILQSRHIKWVTSIGMNTTIMSTPNGINTTCKVIPNGIISKMKDKPSGIATIIMCTPNGIITTIAGTLNGIFTTLKGYTQ